jgi:hypothetical protein
MKRASFTRPRRVNRKLWIGGRRKKSTTKAESTVEKTAARKPPTASANNTAGRKKRKGDGLPKDSKKIEAQAERATATVANR